MSNKGAVRPLARTMQVQFIARRAAEQKRAMNGPTFPPPKALPPRPKKAPTHD